MKTKQYKSQVEAEINQNMVILNHLSNKKEKQDDHQIYEIR